MTALREVRVEGHRLIRAPLHRVWQVLSRLESHPRYATLWLTADLLERSQAAALVEFRGFFGGLPATSVQRVVLKPPGRIEFRQVRGTLRALSGSYILRDADGETDLTMQMAVDAGIVIFSDVSVRQILVGHIDRTLTKIKASAERDLVRVTVRRSQATGEVETMAVRAGSQPGAAAGPEEPDDDASAGEEGAPAAETERPAATEAEPAEPATSPATPSGERRRRRRRRRRPRGGPRAGGGGQQAS